MWVNVVEFEEHSAYNQLLWLLEDIASLVQAAYLLLLMDGPKLG